MQRCNAASSPTMSLATSYNYHLISRNSTIGRKCLQDDGDVPLQSFRLSSKPQPACLVNTHNSVHLPVPKPQLLQIMQAQLEADSQARALQPRYHTHGPAPYSYCTQCLYLWTAPLTPIGCKQSNKPQHADNHHSTGYTSTKQYPTRWEPAMTHSRPL